MKSLSITLLVILALCSWATSAQENLEKKKIDFLISSIENYEGAIFIRNGSEYDGKKAAEHLRVKLRIAGGNVHTAEDFIILCASKSFITGKAYLIRLPGGKTITVEMFLKEKLKEYVATAK
jgi:hypothetical protein